MHFLAQVPLFADLPPEDLDRLCEKVEILSLSPGDVLFAEGSMGDKAYIIEKGELEITRKSAGRDVLLAVRRSGEVVGEMSLLEEAPRNASARARGQVLLHAIDHETLHGLVASSASAARGMFYTVLARWKATNATLRQSERMAQLGTLTAGVAHELNNPAAAVRRAVEQLDAALSAQEAANLALGAAGIDPATLASLRDREPEALDPLVRSDREQAVEDALEAAGVAEPWALAPDLVDLGLDAAAIAGLSAEALPVVARWLSAHQAVRALLAAVREGSTRISTIVLALKEHSFLDQAPVQDVDVHKGLDGSLLIVKHKLRGTGVRKEYAPDLPRIEAYGSQLNQVWTNLLDNAADALDGKGTITLRTSFDDRVVCVEIADDGPGIPEEIQGRVFDPFFTTKPPGKGTGQGLDIAWRIVADQHRGTIQLRSRPGATCFKVILPRRLDGGALEVRQDSDEESILASTRTIAVVGISDRADQASHSVPAYLQRAGYRVVPVNPRLQTVLGEPAHASLRDVAEPVDTVLVFRRAEEAPAIVEDAIAIGARAVWMQAGIVHDEAAARAREAGLSVVMDTCMRTAHKRWKAGK